MIFIPDLKGRLIKFRMASGSWKHFTGSYTRIQSLIKKLRPADVYYTQGRFVDALELERKTGSINLIETFLVFDFDEVPVGNVKKLLKYAEIQLPMSKLNYILETSRNNFQVSLTHPLQTTETGIERLKTFEAYNKALFAKVRLEGIEICDSTINPSQVIRLPYSTHRSGFKTRVLTKEDIFKRQDLRLEPNPKEYKQQRTIKCKYKAIKDSIGQRSILYIKTPRITKKMITTLAKYKTGPTYCLNNHDRTYTLISLKTFDTRRLKKIRRALGQPDKERYRFIRTSQLLTEDNKQLLPEPTLELTIGKPEKGQYSRPHAELIKSLGGNIEGIKDWTGQEKKTYEIKVRIKNQNDL